MAFVAGAGSVQCLPALPGPVLLSLAVVLGGVALICWARGRHTVLRIVWALVFGLCAGTLNASLQAQSRLDDALADVHQDQVSRLIVRVAELPDGDDRHQRFVAELAEPCLLYTSDAADE